MAKMNFNFDPLDLLPKAIEENRVIPIFDCMVNRAGKVGAPILLDFGCGKNRKFGFQGVDVFAHENICWVRNIDEGEHLPFLTGSVSGIRAIHSVEHVKNWTRLWNEFYRCCQPDALLYIVVPHAATPYHLQDPSHQTAYTEDTFKYLDGEYVAQYSDYGLKCKFKVEALQIAGPSIGKLSIHCILRTVKDEPSE